MSKSVLIIAGEASGDLHGYNLVRAIKELEPEVKFMGIGGERLKEAGVRLIASSSDMAVVGFTEVFTKLKNILRAGIRIKKILKEKRPELLILIDYPDFNLYIAGYAKKMGIPVMYYISPQVWAWRTGRIRKIKERVDRMVVILPFEKDFYEKRGVKVSYVGHPLIDAIPKDINREEIRIRLGVKGHYPVFGIIPGSRKEEIKNILPIMLKALDILKSRYRYKNIIAYLPLANTVDPGYVKRFIRDYPFIRLLPNQDIYNMLAICDIAFVTSGTATLETAIMGVPMIVAYKGSAISFCIAKMLVKVKYISLANLIAGERIVPEILQNDLTPEAIVEEAIRIIEQQEVRDTMKSRLKSIRDMLGKGEASKKAARIAIEMMGYPYGKNSISSR